MDPQEAWRGGLPSCLKRIALSLTASIYFANLFEKERAIQEEKNRVSALLQDVKDWNKSSATQSSATREQTQERS